MTPPGAVGANKAGGLVSQCAEDAMTGMNKQGGHAIRHLQGSLIPDTGSLTSRLESFKRIARPILQNPQKVSPWRIGSTNGTAYLGTFEGQQVVIVIANEGPFSGKVIGAFVPDPNQLRLIIGR